MDDVEGVHHGYGAEKPFYDEAGAVPEEAIVAKYGRAETFFRKLFAMGVEARGVERVPEDERSDRDTLNSLFLWFSVNTVLTTGECDECISYLICPN